MSAFDESNDAHIKGLHAGRSKDGIIADQCASLLLKDDKMMINEKKWIASSMNNEK